MEYGDHPEEPLELASDARVVVDGAGNIVQFNAAAERLFGYQQQELQGRPIAPLIVDELGTSYGALYFYDPRRDPSRPELTGVRKDRSQFRLAVRAAEVRAGDQGLFATLMREISDPGWDTQRRLVREQAARAAAERAEAEAREHARRLQVLAEAAHIFAKACLDPDSTLQEIARYCAELIGDGCTVQLLGPDNVLYVRAFYSRDPQVDELARKTFVGAATPSGGLSQLVLRTGKPALIERCEPKQAEAISSPAFVEFLRRFPVYSIIAVPLVIGGRIAGTIALARGSADRPYCASDLTMLQDLAIRAALAMENTRLYRDLQSAVQVRDDFLAMASHELKSPLTSLLLQLQGMLQIVGDLDSTDPLFTEGLKRANRSAKRLERLTNQMLDVSRIAAGKLSLEPERCDLGEVVREVVRRFDDEQVRAGSAIVVRGERSIIGRWDRLRIDQVVTNLLSNAVKYGQDKEIVVELVSDGESAVMHVIDQGIGIPEDRQQRIFERFERAVGTWQFGGFGLGLWIARQIVDASGGRIAVDSAPGRGSTFSVRLPLGQ
jgi:PAS domain S-box-containing protein